MIYCGRKNHKFKRYAYLTNVYSGRRMASLLEENVFFMWLSGMNKPNFRTINLFRSEKLTDGRFESIFHQVVELLHDEITKEDLKQQTDRILEKMNETELTNIWKRWEKGTVIARLSGCYIHAHERRCNEQWSDKTRL